MATIDSLEIQIAGSAQKANVAINDLIKNLGRLANSLKIDTSGLEKIGKSLNFSGVDKAAKNIQSQTQKVSKSLSQITEQYKDLGKGFEIKGSTQQIQKQIDSLTNKLSNAKLAKDDFEASGKTNLGGYETAVKNVIKYTNQIESLKNQLAGLQTAQPKLDFNVTGTENATKYLIEYKKQLMDLKSDVKSASEASGGVSNMPKAFVDNRIQTLRTSIEELKQSYPQATNVISAFEKELQKLQGISAGLTREPVKVNVDTNSAEQARIKMEEIKRKFAGRDWGWNFTGNFEQLKAKLAELEASLARYKQKEQNMISSGEIDVSRFEKLQVELSQLDSKINILQSLKERTEAFNQSLQKLKVPPIKEENLTKLQNALKKTESHTIKLKNQLSSEIAAGKIIPNIDDSGFRNLTRRIAESEKYAEALKQRIQEVGGDTGGTGGKFEKLKEALSKVFTQSNKASSATNILGKNIKKLSSSMSGFSKSAGKAVTGMKSFARQALSAMGIYLGVYGTVRGLKSSIESSMNYIEILNYFNAAFGQVAEKADYSKFEEMGYDSAEAYYNSFSERAKELTQKMTGFTMKENGMLESGGMKSLGINPAQLMNYQAMFAQMSSSMGVTSENALRLSTVLTEIGADLASVKNMKFEKVWNDMASGLAGMSRTLDKYGANIRNVNLQQKLNELGISANISALNQNDKALLRTIILLDSTRYAWGDLAKTIDQPANQLRLLQSNFSNLWRAIGNIFLPIVAKVLPYINMLVQALTRLAEWLVKLLGFEDFEWGGGGGNSTPDVLGDIYDNAEDASGALDKVSESAKKAKAGLRGFDELKTINMPESEEPDGGSGGAGAGGIGGGALQGALDSILDEYQAAWDKAFSEMENRANTFADNVAKAFKEKGLYGVGEYFSKSITKALENIPWDSVYGGARNFGKGLAKFLNGLISPELFSSVGKTIAGSLNTALHFLDSFGETFKWENFGKSLASGLVSFLKGIDWETALSAASNWGKGIGTALNNFITPETFGEVGKAVAMALNTAVQFVLNLGATLDFYQFGQSVATGISKFFATFDFASLAETLNVWVDNLWDFIKGIIDGISWGDIWKGVKDFFSNLELDTAVVLSIAVAPLAIAGFTKFIGILSNVWGIVGKVQGAFQILSIVLGSITAPMALVVSAIATLVTGLGYVFSTNEDVRKSFSESVDAITKNLNPALEMITKTVLPDLKKGWNGLKGILKPFGDFLKDVFTSIWQDMINPALKYIGDKVLPILVSTFENLWKNVLVPFGTFLGDVLKPIIKTISDVLSVLWKNVVVPLANAIGKTLGKEFEGICGILNKTVIPIVNSVIKVFQFLWNDVFSPIVRFLKKTLGPVFSGVFETIGEIIEGLADTFGGLIDFITGVFSGDWEKAWEGIKDVFEGIWKTLLSPIKLVVNGIIKGINWVLKAVGAKELDPWEPDGFATGSNGLPRDTIGIVNDQKGNVYKELIVPPHGKPFIPEGRNVMLPMEKGTKIMPARQTKDFMEKMNGIPRFAGGIGDFFKGAWAKISEFTGNVWDYISNPGKILQIAFDKFTDLSGMLEPVLSIAKGAASTLLDGATGFIKKMFDENLTVQYNPSKGVEQWRGIATKALQMTSQFTEANLNALLYRMNMESSGNPKAINLWDSNAKRGNPSKGLMQVIPTTFAAYAMPGFDKDIWDPLSNILASIRYTLARYGSLTKGWLTNKGYASGIGKINLADLIPQYRAGGFPEDGWFRANHGEIMGRFDNGQSVVANNKQITDGIAAAVYPAVYNAVSSAMRNSSLLNDILEEVEKGHEITLDGEPVYKKMIKRAKEDMRSGRNGRLVVAEELY